MDRILVHSSMASTATSHAGVRERNCTEAQGFTATLLWSYRVFNLDKKLRSRTQKWTDFILSYLCSSGFVFRYLFVFLLQNKHSLLHVNTDISFNKFPAEVCISCVSPESHIIWTIPASDRHLGNRKMSLSRALPFLQWIRQYFEQWKRSQKITFFFFIAALML